MDTGKLIVINFGSGNLNIGFDSIILRIEEDNKPYKKELPTKLPQKPEIVRDYSKWLDKCFPVPSMVWNKVSQAFSKTLNDWFKSEPFYSDWNKLLSNCTHNDKIRVIFQTELWELQRIPWQFWDFFQIYPKAEMALSLREYESINNVLNEKIRILAIIGDSTGIDLEPDIALIKQLPNVEEPKILCQPPRSEISDRLWQQNWDILFFAGHSKTEQGTGCLYINNNEFLRIEELQEGLKNAISRGLKLAIFNSCDGLGLARSLASLNLPQAIVMRQPVQDKVAQEFLKHFLKAFSQNGQTLYLAVKEAKYKLREELGREFPCANWLPVIYQNPAIIPPTWEQLCINPITTIAANPPPIQPVENKLHKALLRLNYTGQVPLFRTIVENYPIGACLIHGEAGYGQQWLLNRLIQLVPNGTAAKVIPISLRRKSRATYITALWRELGGRVGLRGESFPSKIIEKVAQWCEKKTVILIFDDLQEMPEECMNQVISEFWSPLVQTVRDRIPQSQSRLVMFLVDHTGCVEQWNINLAERIDSNWEPHIPILLPRITQICEKELMSWIENSLDELPLKFTTQIEERVQEILNNSEQVLPQEALERICELCDCSWYDWEEKWLKY